MVFGELYDGPMTRHQKDKYLQTLVSGILINRNKSHFRFRPIYLSQSSYDDFIALLHSMNVGRGDSVTLPTAVANVVRLLCM